jgi:hypothetical protein
MPLQANITDPTTGEMVETNVSVQGTYSGGDGGLIDIECSAANSTLGDDQTVSAVIDTTTGTWEAMFTLEECNGNTATGTYTISVGTDYGPTQVTDITVCGMGNLPIGNNNPPIAPLGREKPAPAVRNSNPPFYKVSGTYTDGHDFSNGFYVKTYLSLHGRQIDDHGHLAIMSGGNWEYHLCVGSRHFCVPPYWGKPTLHTELWSLNGMFKLTNTDIKALTGSVTDQVLQKLTPLKYKAFSQENFVQEIKKVLAPDEIKVFGSLITKQAMKDAPFARIAQVIKI